MWALRWEYYAGVPFAVAAAYGLRHLSKSLQSRVPVFAVAIAVVVTVGGYSLVTDELGHSRNTFTAEWRSALLWMHDSTPDSLDYTVMSTPNWGQWIIRIGERKPVAWGYGKMATRFYAAATADEGMQAIVDCGSRYVLVYRGDIEYGMGHDHPMAGQFIKDVWDGQEPELEPIWQSENIRIFQVR